MSDIRFVAKTYLDAGWAVVPLVQGEKRAASNWQKKTYAPQDFGATDGIAGKCGEPSGWRVDVDCDAAEAIEAAKLLLPNTGLIHGRPGKPDSHYWFTCDGIKTTQFTDVRDVGGKTGMLIEIRSTGGYTALPPSWHPSGDQLAWTTEREAMRLAPDDLHDAVRDVAICALLARHWPGPGARHYFAGHLAGFLLQAGVEGAHALRLIKVAATVAGDGDVQDRLVYAQGTVAKHGAGERVTGGPKLAEAIGDDVVARLRSWFKLQDIDAIEEMNQRHFWVRLGKDDCIGREDDSAGVVFQRVRALYSEYANRKIVVGEDKKGAPVVKPLFQVWLEHRSRRSYRSVVFTPPPAVCDPLDYNLWTGYAMEPVPGDCRKFLAFTEDIICSGDRAHYEYLLNLLAFTIQQPGTPSGVATVLRGKAGIGKGVFVRTIGDLFGRKHYTQLDKVDQLAGHFNAALSGKIIVFADEAFWAGDKREVGALKRLVTEPTLHIVRKGIDGVDEANHVHLFMATNEDWSWPAMMNERRGFLLRVSDARMQDTRYFGEILQELANGGRAALLDLLLKHPVDQALLKRVPKTDELREQQTRSLNPAMEWWHECLYEGLLGQLGWPGGTWLPIASVYACFKEWSSAHRTRLLSTVEFGRKLNELISSQPTKMKRTGKDLTRHVLLRNLADARSQFDAHMGSTGTWPALGDDPALGASF